MSLDWIYNFLAEDLKREYQHWHFYMRAANNVTGIHRLNLREFFLKEAAGEMEHIKEFGELMAGFNCLFSSEIVLPVMSTVNATELLEETLKIETEAVHAYAEQLIDLEQDRLLSDIEKTQVILVKTFLEEQLQDSHATAVLVKQMLL